MVKANMKKSSKSTMFSIFVLSLKCCCFLVSYAFCIWFLSQCNVLMVFEGISTESSCILPSVLQKSSSCWSCVRLGTQRGRRTPACSLQSLLFWDFGDSVAWRGDIKHSLLQQEGCFLPSPAILGRLWELFQTWCCRDILTLTYSEMQIQRIRKFFLWWEWIFCHSYWHYLWCSGSKEIISI